MVPGPPQQGVGHGGLAGAGRPEHHQPRGGEPGHTVNIDCSFYQSVTEEIVILLDGILVGDGEGGGEEGGEEEEEDEEVSRPEHQETKQSNIVAGSL